MTWTEGVVLACSAGFCFSSCFVFSGAVFYLFLFFAGGLQDGTSKQVLHHAAAVLFSLQIFLFYFILLYFSTRARRHLAKERREEKKKTLHSPRRPPLSSLHIKTHHAGRRLLTFDSCGNNRLKLSSLCFASLFLSRLVDKVTADRTIAVCAFSGY